MIVVSDTSPINYLILIGAIDVLPLVFDRVLIPAAVLDELSHAKTPDMVRFWIKDAPVWLEVRDVRVEFNEPGVDKGEAAAITLAVQLGALALIDDRRGREFAISKGLSVVGTIGFLEEAGRRGHIDFLLAIRKLQMTNYHIAREILDRIIQPHLSG